MLKLNENQFSLSKKKVLVDFSATYKSVAEVAKAFDTTPMTIVRWIHLGYFLGATKGPGKTSPWRIPKKSIDRFIKHHMTVYTITEEGEGIDGLDARD